MCQILASHPFRSQDMAHTGIKHFWTCTTDPGTSLCQSDQNCFRVLHLLKVLCEKKQNSDWCWSRNVAKDWFMIAKEDRHGGRNEREEKKIAEIERAHDEDENREST